MPDETQPANEGSGASVAAFVPRPLPPARWADPAKARRPVPLVDPGDRRCGQDSRRIYVRKFSVAQIAVIIGNWSEARKTDSDAPLSFPSYVDEDGSEIPSGTMALLEDDDMQTVREVAEAFLPRRFRPDPEPAATPAASGPSTGDTTEPSSDA